MYIRSFGNVDILETAGSGCCGAGFDDTTDDDGGFSDPIAKAAGCSCFSGFSAIDDDGSEVIGLALDVPSADDDTGGDESSGSIPAASPLVVEDDDGIPLAQFGAASIPVKESGWPSGSPNDMLSS